MKIAFVCKNNIWRSQLAEEFFNKASKKHQAISAWFNEVAEDQKVIWSISTATWAVKDADVFGIDIRHKARNQLSKDLLKEVEKVFVLVDDIPEEYKDNPKIEIHPFVNKRNLPLEARKQIVQDIKKFAEDLAKSLDNQE